MKEIKKELKESKKAKPNEYVLSNLKLVEWVNKTEDGESYNSYQFSKFYKDGEEWKSTANFGDRDLRILRDLIDQVLVEKFPVKFKRGD